MDEIGIIGPDAYLTEEWSAGEVLICEGGWSVNKKKGISKRTALDWAVAIKYTHAVRQLLQIVVHIIP